MLAFQVNAPHTARRWEGEHTLHACVCKCVCVRRGWGECSADAVSPSVTKTPLGQTQLCQSSVLLTRLIKQALDENKPHVRAHTHKSSNFCLFLHKYCLHPWRGRRLILKQWFRCGRQVCEPYVGARIRNKCDICASEHTTEMFSACCQ